MDLICVTNVVVKRNPAGLREPFELEVSLECRQELEEDLEWRLIYVGKAEDKTQDQELDSVALGPINIGTLRFIFLADAPDYNLIEKEEINGITIILLTGCYRNQEFVRVGWYVHNYFVEPMYVNNPPDLDELPLEEMISSMQRLIIADAPRVTRFSIDWFKPGILTGSPFPDLNLLSNKYSNDSLTAPVDENNMECDFSKKNNHTVEYTDKATFTPEKHNIPETNNIQLSDNHFQIMNKLPCYTMSPIVSYKEDIDMESL